MKELIRNWLKEIERNAGIPPKEVIAFNFGIYESETGYKIYLVGGFEYDEDDDDWACIEMPTESYFYLDLPENFQSKQWDEILEICVKSLIELEEDDILNTGLLKNAMAITIGFDDGDLIKIR